MLNFFNKAPSKQRERIRQQKEDLQSKGAELVNLYNQTFASPNVCEQMRLIESTSLKTLSRADLRTATAILGIDTGNAVRKDQLCQQVKQHYQARIALLQQIQKVLENHDAAVTTVLAGSFCHNGLEIAKTDAQSCKSSGLIWSPARLEQYQHRNKYNRAYTAAVRKMLSSMNKAIGQLDTILATMVNKPEHIDDERLAAFQVTIDTSDSLMHSAVTEFISHTRYVMIPKQELPYGADPPQYPSDMQLLSDEEISQRDLEESRKRKFDKNVQSQMKRSHDDIVKKQAEQIKQHYNLALQ